MSSTSKHPCSQSNTEWLLLHLAGAVFRLRLLDFLDSRVPVWQIFSWLRDLVGREAWYEAGYEVGFIKIRAGIEDLRLYSAGTEVQTESFVSVDWRRSEWRGLKGLSTRVTSSWE